MPHFLGLLAGGKAGGQTRIDRGKNSPAGNILALCPAKSPRIFCPLIFCAYFLPKDSPKCALLGGPKGLSTLSPFALSTKSGRKNHGKSRLFNSVHKLYTKLSTVLGNSCAGGFIRVSCEKCENSRTNHYTTDGRKKEYVREKVTKEGGRSRGGFGRPKPLSSSPESRSWVGWYRQAVRKRE